MEMVRPHSGYMNKATKTRSKATKAPRVVHVLCASAADFRWLKCHLLSVAVEVADGSFQVMNEDRWSELLSASGGKEV